MNEEFIKIIVVIIITALFSVTLKSHRAEYSFLLTLCVAAAVLAALLYKIYPTVNTLTNTFKKSGVTVGYFLTALKALGISYITSFAADSCRDAGQSALASKAEFAGKCAVFVLTVPLILNVLEKAVEFASL